MMISDDGIRMVNKEEMDWPLSGVVLVVDGVRLFDTMIFIVELWAACDVLLWTIDILEASHNFGETNWVVDWSSFFVI